MAHLIGIRLRLLGGAFAALAVLAVAARPATAVTPADSVHVYPRLAVPGAIRGTGVPYLDTSGNLDLTVIDAVSRFNVLILDASPVSEYHPEIIGAIRARNPRILALAYVLGGDIWDANQADSTVNFPTRYNHMVRDMNGYLYNKRGEWFHTANVNLAKRSGFGRYVVAEAVANLFADAVMSTGLWDGMFVDVFCDNFEWAQTPTDSIDFVRAGYSDLASFDAAWKAGTDTLASVLRRRVGPGAVLVGNCGLGSKYSLFNGWTRENFPFQNGGTWYTNMYWDPGGYFVDDARFLRPTCNVIFTPMDDLDPFDANDARRMRFGLGSAALGSGVATFGPSTRDIRNPPHETWWYDEYAVDLATGGASSDIHDTGWLGLPLGDYYQMVWNGSGPDAVTNPGFETDVTSGWTFGSGPFTSSIERDTTTAAVGAASAHVLVPATTPWSYATVLTSNGTLAMTAGVQYSATFWAKAATPRTIWVAAANPGPGALTVAPQALTTEWRHYQVALISPSSGIAELQFQFGKEAGDVWLDDVHFQAGATSVYRRDFQNGIVLVNPSSSTLDVPLEREYRRITGVVDPVVNDGSRVTVVTIPPSDARFLIGTDQIPPRAVTDLRRIP